MKKLLNISLMAMLATVQPKQHAVSEPHKGKPMEFGCNQGCLGGCKGTCRHTCDGGCKIHAR